MAQPVLWTTSKPVRAVPSVAAMEPTPLMVDGAEKFVSQLHADPSRPREHECLCCYVARSLDEFPCDGTHRHALRYRDLMAPRATALLDRLSRVGACCDCELFLNGYLSKADFGSGPSDEDADDGGLSFEDLPPCQGVRRGTVQPCTNWVRVRRGRW
jgi:hypothetical protein